VSEPAFEEVLQAIRGLSTQDLMRLSLIAMGGAIAGSVSPHAATRLQENRLVTVRKETIPGWPPVIVSKVELASLHVHMAWAQVCSELENGKRRRRKATP
jgi:hypothetical protein